MCAGPKDVSTAQDRVAGYEHAFHQLGLDVPNNLIFHDAYTVSGGQRMAQQALAAAERPTALFAANNFIAIGAFQLLRERGLRVPEDISLVTFDDLPQAMLLDPFLTAATQSASEMGRRATELLLARIFKQDLPLPQEIVLPTSLIERRSTAPPR